MNHFSALVVFLSSAAVSESQICTFDCPTINDQVNKVHDEPIACGFDAQRILYKLFPNQCSLESFNNCHGTNYTMTAVKFCVIEHFPSRRRYDEEPCPAFCPEYYRPVCAASRMRSYKYRTFNNRCVLDMLNCYGDEDDNYVEVSLNNCPGHLMKNIFKEHVIVTGYGVRDGYDNLFAS